MTKKKSSHHQRKAAPGVKRSVHQKWMHIFGIVIIAVFTFLVLLLMVMSVYRYYHIISHH